MLVVSICLFPNAEEVKLSTDKISVTVIGFSDDKLTVLGEDSSIYIFESPDDSISVGENVVIEYTGVLDDYNSIVNITPVSNDEDLLNSRFNSGIFSQFNTLASNKINGMSLDEKIGQLLLVRYPDSNAFDAIDKYKVGGFVFFEKDFANKTKEEVQTMISTLQTKSDIPLLTAVDEEGGSVVRVSSNSNLASSPFASPRDLYSSGGFELISEDTKEKSNLLKSLGLNVNLAPVVDVSTDPNDYMYDRALGESTQLTSTYAKTVIEASKNSGVSYVLKHFPGYGNNDDSHAGVVMDNRSFSDIEVNDLPPFEEGINTGAEAVLVSHNTIVNIDNNNPASLSASIHNLLRSNLNFTGVIISDDLSMGALSSIDNVAVKALLAGNDIIITTDYVQSFNEIKDAVANGTISEELINNALHRVISWKYYKGIMYGRQK